MWIMSQDGKVLIKANLFRAVGDWVYATTGNGEEERIGMYMSEGRAQEVLRHLGLCANKGVEVLKMPAE
jgi:hypothetical protein